VEGEALLTAMVPADAADQLRSAQEAGEISRSLDPELEATSLFALADGLSRSGCGTVTTTLPRTRPASRCGMASGASLSG